MSVLPLFDMKIKPVASYLLSPPILLAGVTILAYGLIITKLGFYWDDLPMSWIRYQLGPEAMAAYFSSNRPVWGMLYQLTTRILPYQPIYWQAFALIWRWVSGVLVWMILRELWPARPRFALGVSLLFLVYPGFNQHWGAYLYSHFFIVLNFFLLSMVLMLRAGNERYWLWTSLAMLCSALNLWMHEYFFTLEAARIFIIWLAVRKHQGDSKAHLRRTFSLWMPYLAVYVLAILSRLFIFNNQIYEIGGEGVGLSVGNLLLEVPRSLWLVTVSAWGQVFQFPTLGTSGPLTTIFYALAAMIAYGLVISVLFRGQVEAPGSGQKVDLWWAVGLGAFILLVAGWPFWLTGVPVSLAHPASRSTLSFMLGVSLVIGGLVFMLPRRFEWVMLAALVGFAVGRQFLWSNEFRRDWEAQTEMFWQMTWRAPGLQPGTIVVMNEELAYYADNSIGASLNLIYAPENHGSRVDYVLFYPTNRLGSSLADLRPGIPVSYDYLAAQFEGNTSQMLAFYYAPPGCLRLLDPEIDPANRLIPDDSLMRDAAVLSNSGWILSETVARMPEMYGQEPTHNWCYYFERADLARQKGDWERVAELGAIAFGLDDYPNDPLERFVFIEGYAHVGEWDQALKYAQVSYKVSKKVVGPLLCRLWDRIEREVPDSLEKNTALLEAKTLFVCNP